MTNREWVTLLYFFAIQSHQMSHPWPTGGKWHYFISLPGCSINPGSEWHCIICLLGSLIFSPWSTGSKWHCFISLPECLINHFLSHDQQYVSGTCFVSLPGSLINYVSFNDQQTVSDTALFLCQVVSSITSQPMINREWVTVLYFFVRQSHQSCLVQSWLTACECHCFISLPLILSSTVSEWHAIFYSHFSSYHKQPVSENTFFHQTISPNIMTNSKCVMQLFIAHIMTYWMVQQEVSGITLCVQSSPSNLISWPIESQSSFWHNMLLHFISQLIFGRM